MLYNYFEHKLKHDSKGIPSAAVHSNKSILSDEQKKNLIQEFRDNMLQVLFTVDLFNEGVDFP
ncbi:MAG: helicase-related protein, partial [[Clostridium] innocuum]